MRYLNRTIIVLVVLSMAMGGIAFAQNSSGEITATYTISGSVGLPGVVMRGLPDNPVTDQKGRYSVKVERDWHGSVTPEKEGYVFEPPSMIYENLDVDRFNDNYTSNVFTFTISGRVGMAGVLMRGLPGDPITDNEGIYRANVPYRWTGTVEPTREGYAFIPPVRKYGNVGVSLTDENYALSVAGEGAGLTTKIAWPAYTPSFAGEGANAQYEDMYGRNSSSRQRGRRSAVYNSAIGPISSRGVLVVPANEVKAQDIAEITEDMQVMSLILDERFKETRRVQGVFTDFGDFFGRDNRQTEATYLQGYGVLFSMEVNFAFSPPPKPQGQETKQPAENVDSTWQRARQQVFSPGDPGSSGGSDSAEEYNSQMVEELKRDLITTLKHAANVRGVQPDELVILTVIGGGRQSGGVYGGGFMMGGMGGMYGGASSSGMSGFGGRYGVSSGSSGSSGSAGGGMRSGMTGGMGGGMMGGMGGGMGAMGGMGVVSEMSASPATVLTIRAKKSDIDAFAKGEQDFEQFRQKVQIFTY